MSALDALTANRELVELLVGRRCERAAADRRAAENRAALERVRAELEQVRTDHHDELAQLRREAAEERAALRREAGEQLTAVLARFDTTPGADTASTLARRGRAKPAAE